MRFSAVRLWATMRGPLSVVGCEHPNSLRVGETRVAAHIELATSSIKLKSRLNTQRLEHR
jgi:hypothetical protein